MERKTLFSLHGFGRDGWIGKRECTIEMTFSSMVHSSDVMIFKGQTASSSPLVNVFCREPLKRLVLFG